MKKLFLVGGGTGGHCIPINVVYSKAPKNKCFILTDNRGKKYFDNIDSNNVIILRNLISSIKTSKYYKYSILIYSINVIQF